MVLLRFLYLDLSFRRFMLPFDNDNLGFNYLVYNPTGWCIVPTKVPHNFRGDNTDLGGVGRAKRGQIVIFALCKKAILVLLFRRSDLDPNVLRLAK